VSFIDGVETGLARYLEMIKRAEIEDPVTISIIIANLWYGYVPTEGADGGEVIPWRLLSGEVVEVPKGWAVKKPLPRDLWEWVRDRVKIFFMDVVRLFADENVRRLYNEKFKEQAGKEKIEGWLWWLSEMWLSIPKGFAGEELHYKEWFTWNVLKGILRWVSTEIE